MKTVVQVVSQASLSVDGKIVSKIGQGLVVFFCVEKDDIEEKLQFFAKKLPNLRVFPDQNGKTNLSVKDVGGEILFVSQFTLAGDCDHGYRPSFTLAEEPTRAKALYEKLGKLLEEEVPIKYGVFGADMKITQINEGPFTIILQK
ncbi:MAG: D-aminoacyl-tRNA deacylase [Candidatus Caccovivens sp.]